MKPFGPCRNMKQDKATCFGLEDVEARKADPCYCWTSFKDQPFLSIVKDQEEGLGGCQVVS